MMSTAFAMPPAPPGPYQSVEDDFIQDVPASSPEMRVEQRPVMTPEQIDRETNEWGRGASGGSYQHGNPAPDNDYPHNRADRDYRNHPMGEAR